MAKKISPNIELARKHKLILEKQLLKEYTKSYMNADGVVKNEDIALLNYEAFRNVKNDIGNIGILNNDSTIISNKYKRKELDYDKNIKAYKESMESKLFDALNENNFFEVISGKNQTGKELMDSVLVQAQENISKTINVSPSTNMNIRDVQQLNNSLKNYMNIFKNGGNIASYDFEAVGGVNKYGHQQINFITEISGSIYKIDKGGKLNFEGGKLTNEIHDFTTVLGISKQEHTDVLNMLKRIKKKGSIESGLETIALERGMVYGNKATKFEKGEGYIHKITDSISSSDIKIGNLNDAVDEAIRGYNELRRIGIDQEKWISENQTGYNIDSYRQKLLNEFDDFIYNGKVDGKKVIKGNLVTNAYNGRVYDEITSNILKGTNVIKKDPRKIMDAYQLLMYAEETLGPNVMIPKGKMMSNKFGKGTLEGFADIMGLTSDGAAHIAKDDQMMTLRLFSPEYLLPHFEETFKKAYNQNKNKFGKDISRKTFLTNKGIQRQLEAGKAFGFSYDPISKQYKSISGYSMRENKADMESFKEFGPKQNTLVKHEVERISLNDEKWKAIFDKALEQGNGDTLYQEFRNAKELYVLKTVEDLDKDLLKKAFGEDNIYNSPKEYFTFFTDKDAIPTMLGDEILDKSGKVTKAGKALNFYVDKSDGKGGVGIEKVSLNGSKKNDNKILRMLRARTFDGRVNDSAMRTVRDYDTRAIGGILDFMKANNGASISQYLSMMVSQNKKVGDIALPLADILESVEPFKHSMTNEKLLPESVKKINSLGKYVSDNKDFYGLIQKVLDSSAEFNHDGLDPKNKDVMKSVWQKRSLALKSIFEDIAGNYIDNKEVIKKWESYGGNSRILTEAEMNKIHIPTSALNPASPTSEIVSSMGINSKGYTAIDLSNPHNLFKNFFTAKFTGDRFTMKGTEGFESLLRAYDAFEGMEDFKGVWKGLTRDDVLKYKNSNYTQLAGDMVYKLRKFTEHKRKRDSSFGRQYSSADVDVTSSQFLKALVNTVGIDKLSEDMSKTLNNMPNVKIFNNHLGAVDPELVNKIVNDYIMNIDEEAFQKELKTLEPHQQKALTIKRGVVEQEAREQAEEFITAIGKTDASIAITGKGKDAALGVIEGTSYTPIHLYRHNLKGGTITTQIGQQEYATRFGFNVKGINESKGLNTDFIFDDISLATEMSNSRKATNIVKSVEHSLSQGKPASEAIVSAVSRQNKALRDGAVSVGNKMNYELYSFSNNISASGLTSILPELSDDLEAFMDKTHLNDGFFSDDDRKIYKDMITRLKKQANSGDRVMDISGLMPEESLLLRTKLTDPLLEMLATDGKFNEDAKYIIENITTKNKDTSLQKDLLSFGGDYADPLAKLDDGGRPPVTQVGGGVFYNKEAIRKQLKGGNPVLDKAYTNVDSVVSSALKKKYMTNAGGRYTTNLNVTELSIGSNDLKNIFINEYHKNGKGKYNKFIEKTYGHKGKQWLNENRDRIANQLLERGKSLSTFEQQGIMNSRIADLAFHETDIKRIENTKEMMFKTLSNMEQVEYLKNVEKTKFIIDKSGNIRYQVGRNVERNQFLFEVAQSDLSSKKIHAKSDALLRLRYVNEFGEAVSEDELNKKLKEHFGKKKPKLKQAETFLDKHYKQVYEIIGKDDKYGVKVFSGPSEKSTADVLKVRVGEYDKSLIGRINDYSRNLEGDEKKAFLKIKDSYLQKGYLDSFVSDVLHRTDEGKRLFKDISEEQHIFSDFMQEFDEFRGVGYISNMDVVKHTSASIGANNFLENLSREGLITKENMDKIVLGDNAYKIENVFGTNRKGIMLNDRTWEGFDLDKESWIKKGMSKEVADKIDSLMTSTTEVKNSDGKVIGHKRYSQLTHVEDDLSGTVRGNDNYYYGLKNKVAANEKKIKVAEEAVEKLQNKKNLSSDEINALNKKLGKIEKLKEANYGFNNELSSWDKSKGYKYSERANTNLQRLAYTQDRFDSIKESMIEGYTLAGKTEADALGDFDKMYGKYLNANGNVADDFNGKRILDPIIGNINEKLLITDGEKFVSDIKHSTNLRNFFKRNFQGDITVDKAEGLYSFYMGNDALRFNELFGNNANEAANYTNRKYGDKFNMIDLSTAQDPSDYLQFDIGGQGDFIKKVKNNPYSDNLMIKTGLGGKYQYLAVGQMPTKHFGDKIIESDHMKTLRSLQEKIKIINNNETPLAEKDKAKERAIQLYDKFVKEQKKDINSKQGIIGQITEHRMKNSMFGRASGITINTYDDKGVSFRPDAGGDASKYYENLKKHNGEILEKAKIQGKSILQHYSEGTVVDGILASREAFENFGYFKDDFMDSVFEVEGSKYKGKFKTRKAKIAAMENLLETQGDTFLSARFPEIQAESNKILNVFMDKSLKGNQLKSLGHTAMGHKQDHDGDQIAIAQIETNGKTSLHYNAGIQDAKLAHIQESANFSMMSRAHIENRYWDDRVAEKLLKEESVASLGANIKKIAEKNIVGGKLKTAIIPNEINTREKLRVNYQKYSKLISESKDAFAEMSDREKESRGINSYHRIAEERISNTEGLDLNEYHTAAGYDTYINEATAKIYKNAVGSANVTNFKIKHLATQFLDTKAKDYDYQSNLIYQFFYQSEEKAISAKSDVQRLDVDRNKKYNDSIKRLLNAGSDTGKIAQEKKTLMDWGHKNLKADIDWDGQYAGTKTFRDNAKNLLKVNNKKEFKLAMKDSKNVDIIFNKTMGDMINIVEKLGNEDKNIVKAIDFISTQTSSTGVGYRKALNAFFAEEEISPMSTIYKALSQSARVENNIMSVKMVDTKISNSARNFEEAFSGISKKSLENVNESKSKINDIMESTRKMFSNAKGRNIALGAVGIAAAVMTAGFVGGKPKPAQTHAMEEATNDTASTSNRMALADNSIMSSQGNNARGYVVNINARTNEGRDNAVSAIQKAISSNVRSGNVNIQMNVNENYGNVSDHDMKEAIWSAF